MATTIVTSNAGYGSFSRPEYANSTRPQIIIDELVGHDNNPANSKVKKHRSAKDDCKRIEDSLEHKKNMEVLNNLMDEDGSVGVQTVRDF